MDDILYFNFNALLFYSIQCLKYRNWKKNKLKTGVRRGGTDLEIRTNLDWGRGGLKIRNFDGRL